MRQLIDRNELIDRLPSGSIAVEDVALLVGSMPVYGEAKGLPFISRKRAIALLDLEHQANDELVRNALKQQQEMDYLREEIEMLKAKLGETKNQLEYWENTAQMVYTAYKKMKGN